MTGRVLPGLDGSNPLGFLAAVGLLRVAQKENSRARLAFETDGTFKAVLVGVDDDLPQLVARDAAAATVVQPWLLTYQKQEKRGTKEVADLKAPPEVFAEFLGKRVDEWINGEAEGAEYAAAFGTSVAVDNKGNTKPTAFHFTAANQQFLGTVQLIRRLIDVDRASRALFEDQASEPGPNLRWDPSAERNWALMASNPNDDGTRVNAPLEWLAFRALPLFPCFPQGTRVTTTAVTGRGDDMAFSWPLWAPAISLDTVLSVIRLPWATSVDQTAVQRGIFAVCRAPIKRTSQGFGNFGPAAVFC